MGDETAAQGVVRQELGTLEVADQVFRDLVRKVACDVAGVAGVGRSGGLFRRGGAAEAVQVERAQGEVAFAISISVRYDVRIPELVEELRRRVKSAVEETTGYKVRAVSVTVEHILPPEAPRGDAAPQAVPDLPPMPGQQ